MNARIVSLSLVTLACAACPQQANTLDGSIKESRDLTFDTVQLRYLSQAGDWDLQYLKQLEGGGDDDVVAKIAFTEPEGGPKADKEINLLDDNINGVVQRNTAGGASDTFPDGLERGNITFADVPKVGETVDGNFAATFDNGKTLFGTFQVKVREETFD